MGGLLSLIGFVLQGSLFLSLKTEGQVLSRVKSLAFRLWIPVLVLLAGVFYLSQLRNRSMAKRWNPNSVCPILSIILLLVTGVFIYRKQYGWSFILNSLTIVLVTVTAFLGLFPRVMVSSLIRLESDNNQCFIQPLYAAGYVRCGFDLCSDSAGLPGMDILDFPQTGDRGSEEAGLLIKKRTEVSV